MMYSSAQEEVNRLRNKGVSRLYHVTDASNLESIITNMCICSWDDMDARGINACIPGGDAVTHHLDSRAGLTSSVHLYLTEPDDDLINRLRASGRIKDPKVLEISPEVILSGKTEYTIGYGSGIRRLDLWQILDSSNTSMQKDVTVHVRGLVPYKYIMNMPDSYTSKVSSIHPTAIVFVLDHSESMSRSTEINGQRYDYMSDAVASIVNRQISRLIDRCTSDDDVKNLFDIAVVGYGTSAYSAWRGELKGRDFVGVKDLIKARESVGETDYPWVEPRDDGEGSHADIALQRAHTILNEWMDKQRSRYYYPPTIVHITDGNVSLNSKSRFIMYAEKLKALKTFDGNVLLWNINISPDKQSELLLPNGTQLPALINSGLELYEASSYIPEAFREKVAEIIEDDMDIPRKAMGVNVSMESMSKLIELSTYALRSNNPSDRKKNDRERLIKFASFHRRQ